jgi:hypothetical protein
MKHLPDADADALCARFTAFDTIADLLRAWGTYFPTLLCDDPAADALADEYDRRQLARGDRRRACRRLPSGGFARLWCADGCLSRGVTDLGNGRQLCRCCGLEARLTAN